MIKIKIILILTIFLLSGCATNDYLPFAPKEKYGKNPVKRNKPKKQKTSWTFRQWGHQGN